MKSVSKAQLFSRDELTVIVGGLDVAIDAINGYIDSEMVRGRKPTENERQSMSALKESRREYRKMLKRVDTALKKCS